MVVRAGNILLKIISRCLSNYCERLGVLPGKRSGFRPGHSTTDMIVVIHQLHVLSQKNRKFVSCVLPISPRRTIPSTEYFVSSTRSLWRAPADSIFAVRQRPLLGLVRRATRSSSRVRACAPVVEYFLRDGDTWPTRVSKRSKIAWMT